MSENKYEQRVRQRAEEFASEIAKDGYPGDYAAMVNDLMPAARLSIQREAEAYRLSWNKVGEGWRPIELRQELQSLGLVPQNDNLP